MSIFEWIVTAGLVLIFTGLCGIGRQLFELEAIRSELEAIRGDIAGYIENSG